jgi:predicted amidohydrolase
MDGIHKKKSNMAKPAWRLMSVMKGHAVANGVYVAAANRIGLEQYLPDTEFSFGIFLLRDHTRNFAIHQKKLSK